MFVLTSRWSIPVMSLLLVMSTLQPYFLLPTVQSSSVLPSLMRHIWQPSSSNLITSRTLTTGLFGQSDSDLPPDVERCTHSIDDNPTNEALYIECFAYQSVWLNLVNMTHKGNPDFPQEYECKNLYCTFYCINLVASTFCQPDDYAATLQFMQKVFDYKADVCTPWQSWLPSLDSPPRITNETIQCEQTIPKKDPACKKEVDDRTANITDSTEKLCEKVFVGERCLTKNACKYCGGSADEYLNFIANVWTPKVAECTKWASDESKMECPSNSSSTHVPVGTGTTGGSVVESCVSVLTQKGEDSRCLKEAQEKTAQIKNVVEQGCKLVYYTADCGMKAACALCTDTSDVVALIRKNLPDDFLNSCNQWSSDEPKLECGSSSSSPSTFTTSSSNTLLIVGIIIGVILILVVIGAVVIYCVCFSSDKSGHSSKAGGGRGSRNRSKINSGKAGSTMGSKQQSRVSGGAKQQSRASGAAKQRSRVSGGAKQQSRIGAKQSSRA